SLRPGDSLQSPGYFETARAALSITSATSLGCDTYTEWLAPATSTVWLFARLAYQRSKSGLIVRSLPATTIQLGLVLQAAVVIVAEKLSAKLSTCERAMNAARSLARSAANSS